MMVCSSRAIWARTASCKVAAVAAGNDTTPSSSPTTMSPGEITEPPMDTGTLEIFARSVEVVATIEDHVLHNGFGCAVMEHLHSQQINTPVARVGWPDEFIEHGAVPLLRKKHGITADALVEKILALLKKKPATKTSVA